MMYPNGVRVIFEPEDAIEIIIEKNFVRLLPNSKSKKGQYTVVTLVP